MRTKFVNGEEFPIFQIPEDGGKTSIANLADLTSAEKESLKLRMTKCLQAGVETDGGTNVATVMNAIYTEFSKEKPLLCLASIEFGIIIARNQ